MSASLGMRPGHKDRGPIARLAMSNCAEIGGDRNALVEQLALDSLGEDQSTAAMINMIGKTFPLLSGLLMLLANVWQRCKVGQVALLGCVLPTLDCGLHGRLPFDCDRLQSTDHVAIWFAKSVNLLGRIPSFPLLATVTIVPADR